MHFRKAMDITDGTPLAPKTTPKDFETMDQDSQDPGPSPLLLGRSNSTRFKNWAMGIIVCIISKDALTGKTSTSYIRLTEKGYQDTTRNYEMLCHECRKPFELAKERALIKEKEKNPKLFQNEF